MSIRRPSLAVAFALILVVVAARRASAQDGGAAAPPAGGGTASYHSPMRTACEDELARDTDWFDNLKDRLAGALYVDFGKYQEALQKYEEAVAKGQKPAPPQAPRWFADLTEQMNRKVHADASRYATRNNQHVVAAYAAFWLLTVAFVLVMWRRQRALQAELARLERDLAKAVKDGGAA